MLKGIEFLLKKSRGLLFKRSMFAQDSRDKPENDGCGGRWFSLVAREESSVAFSNKVVDSPAWHSLWGVPLKNDVSGFGLKYLLSIFCKFFKYPSPETNASTSPSGGEVTGLFCCAHNDDRIKGEVGRSMIEMLGVLAIIAVLSVGGIAGYSKAMEKWKLDKWKAQITDLVFSAKDAYKNERKYGNPDENILPTLQQIGAVPQSMLDKDNRDIFGNYVSVKIEITGLGNGTNLYRFAFFFRTKPSDTAVQNCRELYAFSQSDPDVHAVVNWADFFRVCGKNVEDEYKNNYPCFEYNLQQVAEKCKICKEQDCTLILLYRNE